MKPKIVPASPRPVPGISPARENLRAAQQRRTAAAAEIDARVKVMQRAESLIAAVPPMKSRLAALEAKASDAVRDWAISGAAGKPQIDNADEVEQLRADIIEAERLAAAAEGAMPSLRKNIESMQVEVRSELDRIREAAISVLMEDAEPLLLALATHTEAATELRAKMVSLQWVMRHNGGQATLLQRRLNQIPDSTLATDARCRQLIESWKQLSDRLLGDATAMLNESKGGQNVAA